MAHLASPVPVRWWSAGQGFPPGLPDPVVIGVDGQTGREAARRTIREALLSALSAMSGLPAARITLHAAPGEAPFALLDDNGATRRVALSISHDGELSLAAIGMERPVGIDVTCVVDFPDWQAVARDYLGPAIAAHLSSLPAAERPPAFARAWSEREARLKCLGIQLAEWNAEVERRLAPCRCLALDLPEAYVGWLAMV
jgi:4'-phosphopantetheinyl transferase